MTGKHIRMLLVEDNAADVCLVRSGLQEWPDHDFSITHVETLAAAQELIGDTEFDVILLDLGLPDSVGLLTFEAVREGAARVPVVVLSGTDDRQAGVAAVRAGAEDYMVKGAPLGDTVARALLHAIERRTARRHLECIRAAVENAADSVLVADEGGYVVLTNAAFTSKLAPAPAMLTEPSLAAMCHDPEMASQILGFVHGGDSWQGELDMLDAQGATFPVALDARQIDCDTGCPNGIVLTLRDITQRRQAEESLRNSEARFRQLVEHADIGIFTVDSHGAFHQVNEAAADQFDMPAKQILSANLTDVMPQPDADTCMQDVQRAIETRQPTRRDVSWSRAGDLRWHSIYVQPPTKSMAKAGMVNIFMRDITHQKRTEEQLLHEATHDALTGLHNRRYFMDRLRGILSSANRYNFPVSLCVCDLDDFKQINDTHGHLAGDDVLATFGRIITEELRSNDIAGRYGGDEFWVILPHTEPEVAVVSIERIGSRIEKHIFQDSEGAPFSVAATFGIAGATPERRTEQQLLVAADQALYQGKQSGGARIVIRKD